MRATVYRQPLAADGKELIGQFLDSFGHLGLDRAFANARAVFIKPNLTYPVFKPGVTTRQAFVRALVAALRQVSARPQIYIGEGEGGYNSFSMTRAMTTMGFDRIAAEFDRVAVVNVSELPLRDVVFTVGGKPYPLRLPELFFEEIDFGITCPLPKMHCMTGITLAFKNQWGCLPDTMRLKNHFAFAELIAQICRSLKMRFAFLDGRYGLDRNGPMDGVVRELNWFVGSNNIGAFDRAVAAMMGIDWRKIGYLRQAARQGAVPPASAIRIMGTVPPVDPPFRLRRQFWNYPALAAFQSSWLTRVVYLSDWAKLLHDIMYLFRKRPIRLDTDQSGV